MSNKLIIGTAQFGLSYGINNTTGKVPPEEVRNILTLAKEKGITKLDTSYAYGDSEIVLGSTLKNDNFKIISKFLSADTLPVTIFNESLQRLNAGKLYGYLIHHFNNFKENHNIWSDIEKLKNKGLIDKIGFSIYRPDDLGYLFDHNIIFDLIQFPYNILDRSFAPYLEELKNRNIEIHTRSVFLQGLFFMKKENFPEKLLPLWPYIEQINIFCRDNGIIIEELALNGVVHQPDIDGVIIGIDNSEQLSRNINSVWKNCPSEIESFINSIHVKESELLNPVNWNK